MKQANWVLTPARSGPSAGSLPPVVPSVSPSARPSIIPRTLDAAVLPLHELHGLHRLDVVGQP
ncbi:hypothetical protein ABTX34_25845 [Streptomyces sp. NPDC096538]|uniref:hypothetical protein n=1 Tax=Streptomyces sp. NPDC096538 TaxID=3155427 RepID=UPI00331E82A5